MPKYILVYDIIDAEGTQEYEVEANSESEAIKKHKNSESIFRCEEIEVTLSDKPASVTKD